MAFKVNHATTALGLSGALLTLAGCPHRTATASASTGTAAASTTSQQETLLDQTNTQGWKNGWTNLLNDVEQSFTPALPRLEAVEVELVVGNAGASEALLTLSILDADGRELSVVTQNVQTKRCDRVLFAIPNGGLEVHPGQSYRIKLSGDATFGWKYVAGGYEFGAATFNGMPLLADARSAFLFQTFGSK
jgi:hypothetical protein